MEAHYKKYNNRWTKGIKFIKRNGSYVRSVMKRKLNRDNYREMKSK